MNQGLALRHVHHHHQITVSLSTIDISPRQSRAVKAIVMASPSSSYTTVLSSRAGVSGHMDKQYKVWPRESSTPHHMMAISSAPQEKEVSTQLAFISPVLCLVLVSGSLVLFYRDDIYPNFTYHAEEKNCH